MTPWRRGVEETGFADRPLPHDKHDLAFAAERALQGPVQLRQLLLPSYEAVGRLQGSRAGRPDGTRDGCVPTGLRYNPKDNLVAPVGIGSVV